MFLAVGLVLLSACSAAPRVVASSSSPVPIVTVAPSASPTALGGHGGSKLPKGTVRNVLPLPRRPLDIAAGDGALFTIVRSDEGATPILLDGETPGMITYAGGAPWVATRAGVMARLDPTSLAPSLTVHLAPDIRDVASGPGRLWVATRRTIEEIDPSGGETTASYRLPAGITRFAVSPDGTRLYVSLSGPVRHDAVPVIELDADSGSFRARTRGGFAELGGVSGLTATTRGVWIAAPSGNMGGAVFARASDLRQRDGEAGMRHGPITGTNAIQLWLAAHRLWGFAPDGTLQCFDPPDPRSKGYVMAGHGQQLGIGAVVSIDRQVWAGTGHSIDLLVPPRACR
jgi:hypothetical protein